MTIDDFVQITSQGIDVMDYADIVQTLLNRYKAIYGVEIEIDPRSGDGRFIYDVATIINSGCQVISQLVSSMNPSTSTGVFLDIISSFTNVNRESATASQIKAKITNPTSNDITISDISLLNVVADNGDIWTPQDDVTIPLKIQSNSSVYIVYTSPTNGKVTTSSLTFATLNTLTTPLTITCDTFELGREEESDNSLRYRRSSDSTYGITVLEGIQGKLKKVFGVDDCYIQSYAGNSDETSTCYVDNVATTMPMHSISVLVRYNKVNEPTKSKIASTIKNNLTPGVKTNGTTISSSLSNNHIITQTSWYIVHGNAPTITITLSNLYNFGGTTTANAIASALTDYLNNLAINQSYTISNLMSVIQNADPKYMSRNTYSVSSVSGLLNDTDTLNKGCYFDYGSRQGIDYSVTLSSDNTTITIKAL